MGGIKDRGIRDLFFHHPQVGHFMRKMLQKPLNSSYVNIELHFSGPPAMKVHFKEDVDAE
jgi:hypothetical protein